MKPQILWVAFIVFMVGERCVSGQTLVFIRRTNAEIVIAADSRTTKTIISNNGVKTVVPDTMCKIQKCGDFYIVAAGVPQSEAIGYDIYKIAKNVCATENNIYAATNTIERMIVKPLTIIAEKAIISDSIKFRKYRNGGIIQFGIFGTQNDTLVACIRVYKARKTNNGDVAIFKYTDGSADVKSRRFNMQFGLFEIIEDSLKAHKPILRNSKNPVPTMIKLIRLAIERDKTNSVGEPINVIRIRKNGHEWIDQKPPCTEQ